MYTQGPGFIAQDILSGQVKNAISICSALALRYAKMQQENINSITGPMTLYHPKLKNTKNNISFDIPSRN